MIHHARAEERGTAMVVSLFFLILIAGITVTGALNLRAHQTDTRFQFVARSQAVHIARSGLTEAVGWLRKQTSQPVTAFEPTVNAAADPPVFDTLDPDIGLVREFPITGGIWGRYEVWKDWPLDPDLERRAWRDQMHVKDVSMARAGSANGSIWRLRCIGYIYRRVDEDLPMDQAPNSVLAQEMLECEARRLVILTPGQAAINVADGNSCHVNTNGRVEGGSAGAGIYYPTGTGTPTVGPASQNRVTGTPPLAGADPLAYDDSYEAVFGTDLNGLRSIANYVVTDPNEFPSPVPSYSIVVAETSSLHFDVARPLMGTGIVVVVGNVVVEQGSNSNFSGLLYVDGSLTLRAPAEIRGSIICTGNVTLQGVPDHVTVAFDDGILNSLRTQIGNYHLSSTLLRPLASDR